MPLQMIIFLEKLPTRDALERLLLQMDSLVVTLHVGTVAEDLAARGVGARHLLTQMHLAVVSHHVVLARKRFATRGTFARNPAHNRRLLVANIARCTWLLPATALKVRI